MLQRITSHAKSLGIALKTEVFETRERWQEYAVHSLRTVERDFGRAFLQRPIAPVAGQIPWKRRHCPAHERSEGILAMAVKLLEQNQRMAVNEHRLTRRQISPL